MTKRWDPRADIMADADARPGGALPDYPQVPAAPGTRVIHCSTRFSGVVVRLERGAVEVRPSRGPARVFRATPGAFEVGGRVVDLVPPAKAVAGASVLTASGSIAVSGQRARVAQASRILVEGVHDAALVERIWGDDLRLEGIVVERLDGIDHLTGVIEKFSPRRGHHLGVLVDHLVPGSKEARLAEAVSHPHVLVTGTPYVDIWEAIRPAVVGIGAWPQIGRGVDWKAGTCRRLGWPAPPQAWRRILAAVSSYADLEPALVGAVEQLIDFVSEPAGSCRYIG